MTHCKKLTPIPVHEDLTTLANSLRAQEWKTLQGETHMTYSHILYKLYKAGFTDTHGEPIGKGAELMGLVRRFAETDFALRCDIREGCVIKVGNKRTALGDAVWREQRKMRRHQAKKPSFNRLFTHGQDLPESAIATPLPTRTKENPYAQLNGTARRHAGPTDLVRQVLGSTTPPLWRKSPLQRMERVEAYVFDALEPSQESSSCPHCSGGFYQLSAGIKPCEHCNPGATRISMSTWEKRRAEG